MVYMRRVNTISELPIQFRLCSVKKKGVWSGVGVLILNKHRKSQCEWNYGRLILARYEKGLDTQCCISYR
jgi:hypothetical protein